MLFLITGASGMGKSSVRRLLEPAFSDVLDTGEIALLGMTPEWNVAWRHKAVEELVGRAVRSQAEGRHFLICGDPVPPGEVVAAPSFEGVEAFAVCLLDAAEEEQRRRLTERGDDPQHLPAHVAFAAWMRKHLRDPGHMPEVVTNDGWAEMQWDRWLQYRDSGWPWGARVIDTTGRPLQEVAQEAATWLGGYLDAAGAGGDSE